MTPMKPRISKVLKILGILLIWALAVAITLPYAMSQELIVGKYCINAGLLLDAKEENIYVVTWMFSGWILPLLLIGTLYGLCIKKFKEGKFKEENESIKKRNAQNRKVVKMFIIIVGIFSLCTLPYSIFFVATNFMLRYRRAAVDHSLIWVLNYALFVLTNVNTCINPFIYAKMLKEMKTIVRNAWKKFCCRGPLRRGHANSAREKSYAVSQNVNVQQHGEVVLSRRSLEQTFENAAFEKND